MSTPSPIEPGGRRASDADREQVAAVLGEAFASGRLTEAEHAERLDAAFRARTVAELEPLTMDLPPVVAGVTAPIPRRSVAAFSKLRRTGQAALPASSEAVSVCGAIVLDLRHATFPRREVTITASSYLGKVELYVPENAQVYDSGTALFGKRSLPPDPPGEPGGPVIHIEGRSVLGHIRVRRGDHGWRAPA